MAEDLIRYDILVKDALREVIRKVLLETSKAGLPGEHHFFVTFLTTAPGVKISARLKKLYPKQMTIVIQYQFWDLIVTDTQFEINLSFNNISEKLVVPFAAVQSFYDPQASFEAAFDLPELAAEIKNVPIAGETTLKPRLASVAPIQTDSKEPSDQTSPEADEPSPSQTPSNPARVISLDDFRKKRD